MGAREEPRFIWPKDHPFPISEYQARIAQVKAAMETQELDVLVVANPANMNYLTGYDGWSFYVPQVVVLALELEHPLWIGRAQDVAGARFTCYMDDAHILGYPEELVQALPLHPMTFVADQLIQRGLGAARIGVEYDAYYFSAIAARKLKEALPNARFADASTLVNWVRLVKSEAEIAIMRQAGKIADRVMQTAFEHIRPGLRQCDLAGEILKAQAIGLLEFGGDYPAIVPLLPTGVRSSAPHLTWSDRPFEPGSVTFLELCGCRHRYNVPLARTVCLGRPPQRVLDVAAAMVEGVEATLESIRPGVTAEEVHAVWTKTIARHGLVKKSRLGYSIGIGYPPDWGEGTVSLRPGSKTELQPNMCFHLMPGIWLEDFGVEISQPFRVTENGVECLTQTPRELVVI
ncbi:ectoine hydrolase DoeA [Thermus oshimai]